MSSGMRVIDSKFDKGGRKLKKTKHCTNPRNLEKMKSEKKNSRIRKRGHLLGWTMKREKGTTMKNMQKYAKT